MGQTSHHSHTLPGIGADSLTVAIPILTASLSLPDGVMLPTDMKCSCEFSKVYNELLNGARLRQLLWYSCELRMIGK